MKFTTFFSVAALAASAFAAPTTVEDRAVAPAGDAVKHLENIVLNKAGVKQIADNASKQPTKRASTGAPQNADQLITLLKGAVSNLKSQSGSFSKIADSVKSGSASKTQAASAAATQFASTHYELTDIVTELTGAAGLNVQGTDVDTVLNLVVDLVSIVLANVKTIVTVTGLTPQLTSILHSVFGILTQLLSVVIGLVSALLPGLIAALSPLLAGLGNGLLAPLLTPIAALLAGL